MESINISPELPLPEEIKNEEVNTTNLSLEEPKHLLEPRIEEVTVESVAVDVDNNIITQTVIEETKPKGPSYLEKKIETIKKIFLYYTSCSVKTTRENNNEPK